MHTDHDIEAIYSFLRDLRANNNRQWFQAGRERWEEVKLHSEMLAMRLIRAVAEVDGRALRLRLADCTYRIYRDTRFSPDKTPYKDHIGIFVNPPLGKKSPTLGYYFHLEPGNTLICAGTACIPSPLLKVIRRSIVDEIDEYRSIVEDPEFRTCFPTIGFDPVKTVPKGFDRDWPYVDYIRPRNFGAEAHTADDFFRSEGLESRLRPFIRQAFRYNRFINFSIDGEE